MDSAFGLVAQLLERRGRKVERVVAASRASIDDLDLHALAATVGCDVLATVRVVVGVGSAHGIVEVFRNGHYVLRVSVGDSTSAKTNVVVGTVTRVGARGRA